jgi:hypothetical protein
VGRTSSNRIRWHRCSRAHPVHLADPAADLIVELTVLGPEGGSGAGQSAGCDVVRGHSGRPGPGRCRHRVHPAARQSALRQHLRDEIVARSYERTGRETPSRCPAGGGGSWLGRRAPLGSTLTALWPTAHQGRCEVDGPGVPRMPDDYPETFRTYASRRALIVLVNVTAAGCRDIGHPRGGGPDVRRPGLFLAPDYDFRCRSKNSTIRRRASMADASWNCDPVNRPSTAKSTGMSAES